jgi:hypothetical protein
MVSTQIEIGGSGGGGGPPFADPTLYLLHCRGVWSGNLYDLLFLELFFSEAEAMTHPCPYYFLSCPVTRRS